MTLSTHSAVLWSVIAMPARFLLEDLYGKDRFEFVGEARGFKSKVSEIRIKVTDGDGDGDDDIGGGFVAGSGGSAEAGSEGETHSASSEEFLGDESYATTVDRSQSVAVVTTLPAGMPISM